MRTPFHIFRHSIGYIDRLSVRTHGTVPFFPNPLSSDLRLVNKIRIEEWTSLTTRCSRVFNRFVVVLFDVYLDFYYQIHRHLMIELSKFLLPLKIPSEYGQLQRLCDDQEVLRSLAAWKNNVYNDWDALNIHVAQMRTEGELLNDTSLADLVFYVILYAIEFDSDELDVAPWFRYHFRMWLVIVLDNTY